MRPAPTAAADGPRGSAAARARLLLAFGSAVLAVVALTFVSLRTLAARRESAEWVMHTQNVQVVVERILASANEAEAAHRGFLITARADLLEPFEAAETRLGQHIEELAALVRDNPTQQQRVAELRLVSAAKADLLRRAIALRERGDPAAFARVTGGEADDLLRQLRSVVAQMRDEETGLLGTRLRQLERADRWSGIVTWGGAALLTLLLAIAALMVRDEVRRRQEQAEERARVLEYQERLIAIVGHDLRNPLTAVLVSAQMLLQKRDELRPGQANAVDRILRSAARMDALAGLLIDFTYARLGRGIPTRPGPMDARAVVERTVDELRAAYPGREIRVEGPAATVLGSWDGDRVGQLVTNLVGNAIQYGTPGTPVVVSVARDAQDGAEIKVHNHGVPLATGLKLFEPYQRGKEAESLHPRGLGLGLFIVREIARSHGGSVTATSGPEGTTFIVRLPGRPSPAPEGDDSGPRASPASVPAG